MNVGCASGVLVFWHKRLLELVGIEVGEFFYICYFKICEDWFV